MPSLRARSIASAVVIAVVLVAFVACRGGTVPTAAADPVASTGSIAQPASPAATSPASPASPASPGSPAASAPPGTSAPPSIALSPSAAQPAVDGAGGQGEKAGEKSCLMVNVCNCNLGCASVPLSRAQLRPGTRTRVTKGALEKQEVKVVEVVDASGTRVLALTDLDHDHACSLAVERTLIGYGCEASKSGPVPAKACAKGCD